MTEQGLVTVGLIDEKSKKNWIDKDVECKSDWYFGKNNTETIFKYISIKVDDDEGFTQRHISVITEFEYAEKNLVLQHHVWVYPDAPGFRTQLKLKKLKKEKQVSCLKEDNRIEYLPIKNYSGFYRLMGYYNDTQNRNEENTEILKEEVIKSSLDNKVCDWANIICLEEDNSGLIMVKESHKCVNQAGVNTGYFSVDDKAVWSSGCALTNNDLIYNEFKSCWANWVIVHNGNSNSRQFSIKNFDRYRYPVDIERDAYIMANTWGTKDTGEESKYSAREENVYKEIDSQSDLSIDVQQIDDGWQGDTYQQWTPVVKEKNTLCEYDVYPNGWDNVKNYSKEKKVELGIWASWVIPEEDLIKNYKEGGFKYYKIDFANLNTYKKFDELSKKIRNFILKTDHNIRINWDITENAPRIGYFYGREYGNIFVENRKNNMPKNVIYKPHLVLRDMWQISKYINLNKIQIPIQNIDLVSKKYSEAYLYNHSYCVAIALMGTPLFFQETQYYSRKARNEIKRIIKKYKENRNQMLNGFVYPIGEKPNNSSWTGFQNYNNDKKSGYLLIFRELYNKEKSKKIKLPFLENKKIELFNIYEEELYKKIKTVKEGYVEFKIENPADFKFLKFKIID
ncbi:hypothetical protein [Natronospora cellulosivora (SeqCode)]